MSDTPVVVIGAGGHAKVVVSALQAAGRKVAGIYDDAAEKWGQTVLGVPVVGTVADLERLEGAVALIGIGANDVRKRLVERLTRASWATVVHPSAVVHASAVLGEGTVVFAGAVVQPDVVMGRHCIVNTGATVDHDCRLGDYVHAAPGCHLSGNVHLEEGAFLGTGTSTIQGVRVGAWTTVGVGSTVMRDLPGGVVALGSPARVARRIEDR